jgi:hypothetical protein
LSCTRLPTSTPPFQSTYILRSYVNFHSSILFNNHRLRIRFSYPPSRSALGGSFILRISFHNYRHPLARLTCLVNKGRPKWCQWLGDCYPLPGRHRQVRTPPLVISFFAILNGVQGTTNAHRGSSIPSTTDQFPPVSPCLSLLQ